MGPKLYLLITTALIWLITGIFIGWIMTDCTCEMPFKEQVKQRNASLICTQNY